MDNKQTIVFFLTLFVVISANRLDLILPPNPLGPDPPICTSYSSLCHLAYNISDPWPTEVTVQHPGGYYRVIHSNQPICQCPQGQTCPTNWFDTQNSIMKTLTNGGLEMDVKMSYCQIAQASRICRQNEPALVLRGRGAFVFEIWRDFRCRCYRPLFEHRSWREGDYDYFEYSCGKPRCASNRFPTRQCTRVTYGGASDNLVHDYLCRCRRYEECSGTILPTSTAPEVYQMCQPMNYYQVNWNLQNRRK